ncbi:MAG: 50S ribosomal protein L25, partial [Lutimonas sp.]
MKTIEIKAHQRKELGKKETKNLRKENNIPCVMYGGEETVHFYAHKNVFKDLIYTPSVYIVKLDIDGKQYMAALKEIQFHPVSDATLHIDFIQVFEDKPVTMNIPISTSGESIGIKAGGKVRLKRRSLK